MGQPRANLLGSAPISQCLLEGAAKLVPQSIAGHGMDVPVGFAGCRFKILPRSSADVQDVPLVVGQHGGGRVALKQEQRRLRLQIGKLRRLAT